MTPAELHDASSAKSDLAITVLMGWVANAQKLLDDGKLDGLATARIGELLLNACRYLAEREEAAKKAAGWAKREAERDARNAENAARDAAIYRAVMSNK